ncbi:MAG: universal stress protein [Gemmatimonadota bacterium]|jgi:nucleotide-binding universal stress UspA family protein
MFERIVVALDGSTDSRNAADLAIRLAVRFESSLTGLFVVDSRLIEGPAIDALASIRGEPSAQPLRAEILRAWNERSRSELDRFEARATAAGARDLERRAATGLAEEAISAAGRSADLVVMGRRGENADFGIHTMGSTLVRVLRHATHPILVAGPVSSPEIPSTVMVAFDGREGSTRALDLAIRYCVATTARIRLLTAGDERADALLEPAHRLCRDHDVEWESVRLDAEPGNAVDEAIDRWKIDGLFMGAFGHGRIHDLLLGSRTEEILGAVAVPTFLVR